MNELYHHGIKGQKWGVRRFQYEDGKWTPEGRLRYGKGTNSSTGQRNEYIKFRNRKLSGNSTPEDFVKSVGTAAISDYDSRFAQLGHTVYGNFKSVPISGFATETTWNNNSGFLSGKTTVSQSTALTMKRGQAMNLDDNNSIRQMVNECNTDYGSPGTTQNCTKCTATTALRKMGYTGIQAGTLNFPASSDAMSYWFDGAHMVKGNAVSCEREMKQQGAGAFGSFDMRYSSGGGHAVGYSVLSNGSIRIEDGQNSSIFSSITEAINKYGANPNQCSYTRLDNTRPNLKAMAEDGVVVDSGSRQQTTYNVRSGSSGEGEFNGISLTKDQYFDKIKGSPQYGTNRLDGVEYDSEGRIKKW